MSKILSLSDMLNPIPAKADFQDPEDQTTSDAMRSRPERVRHEGGQTPCHTERSHHTVLTKEGMSFRAIETESSVFGQTVTYETIKVGSPRYNAHAAYSTLLSSLRLRSFSIRDIEQILGPFLGSLKQGQIAVFGAVNFNGNAYFVRLSAKIKVSSQENRAPVNFRDIILEQKLEGFSQIQIEQYIRIRWAEIGKESLEHRELHVDAAIQKVKGTAPQIADQEVKHIIPPSNFHLIPVTNLERCRGIIIGCLERSNQLLDRDKHAVCYQEYQGRRYLMVENITCDGRLIPGPFLEGSAKCVELDQVLLEPRLRSLSESQLWEYCSFRENQLKTEKKGDRERNIGVSLWKVTGDISLQLAGSLYSDSCASTARQQSAPPSSKAQDVRTIDTKPEDTKRKSLSSQALKPQHGINRISKSSANHSRKHRSTTKILTAIVQADTDRLVFKAQSLNLNSVEATPSGLQSCQYEKGEANEMHSV